MDHQVCVHLLYCCLTMQHSLTAYINMDTLQVIRHKIGEMARMIEGTHRQLENVCYQVKSGYPDHKLGGYIALMKVDGSRLMEFCAREASQIFGGQSFTREGAGGKVERIYREVRVMAIGGGSEES